MNKSCANHRCNEKITVNSNAGMIAELYCQKCELYRKQNAKKYICIHSVTLDEEENCLVAGTLIQCQQRICTNQRPINSNAGLMMAQRGDLKCKECGGF
jgi:hypothetical protein